MQFELAKRGFFDNSKISEAETLVKLLRELKEAGEKLPDDIMLKSKDEL